MRLIVFDPEVTKIDESINTKKSISALIWGARGMMPLFLLPLLNYLSLSFATPPPPTLELCASADSFRSISISRTDSTRGTRRMSRKSYRPL